MISMSALVKTARRRLLLLHQRANCGHIGGNFSCIDAMMTLHHAVMKPNDRFLLSKGHSAGALYVTLWSQGKISDAELDTFCQENTAFPAHPSGSGIPELLFSTGSLGHGPSLAAGLALAARHKRETHQVYCLCSDGEWQEGSCWEALTFSVHQQLDNLTILIDQNGWQGFGRTEEVISCNNLAPRLRAFGADVLTVNGHNPVAIQEALQHKSNGCPRVIVLETRKGHGLHFEDRLESHYLPLTEEQYSAAVETLEVGSQS